jgi:hypothetical protein
MEIISLRPQSFKLRTKEALVFLEPGKVTLASTKRDLPFDITAPGEYEVLGVSVFAYKHHSSLAFLLVADGLTLVYVGDQSEKLPEELFDQIDEVAVLFASTSDGAVVNQAAPHYLILTQPAASFTSLDRLTVQAGKLPEERETVVLHGRN